MPKIGHQVATGALWMIALKLFERTVGFVSTIILARLLIPADFGLVAMAMIVYGFIEMGGQFGFDVALIRNSDANDSHYNSAWTLGVGYGVFTAVMMILLAIPTAHYFNEPRLVAVMMFLGGVAFVQSLENIGIIEFRKSLKFKMDFNFLLIKKIISFFVTLILAYETRSYWALLGGIAASRISGVYFSYRLHPYRPKFDLSEIKGLLTFSRWIVLRGFLDYFISRGPDLLIARILSATSLGLYRVAHDISTMPTSELIFPIMRAVYPGYAAISNDKKKLAEYFLMVQGIIVMLALPAGIGIVLLAGLLVDLLLGPNWTDSVPLIKILGLYGAVTVFQATNISMFNVLGKPNWGAALKGLELAFLVVSLIFVYKFEYGVIGIAFAVLVAHTLVVPIGVVLVSQALNIRTRERVNVTWRPMIGVFVMSLAVDTAIGFSVRSDIFVVMIFNFALIALLGAGVFALTVLLLWRLVGMPMGPESRIVRFIKCREW